MDNSKLEWDLFVARLRVSPPPIRMRATIRASWQRCAGLGVNRALDNNILLRRVSDLELECCQRDNRDLINAATPFVTAFSLARDAVQHVVYLTEKHGIVLLSRGNHQVMLSYGLCPGFDWSEKTMGTNGAGTALATDSAVAVIGPDHYQLPFKEATCLAAPIHSRTGDLIGAVDFSTHVGDVDVSQLLDIVTLAKEIECALPSKEDALPH